jgi:hypothetical protein
MSEIRVFGCADLRGIIFNFVYPAKIRNGMRIMFSQVRLRETVLVFGIVSSIKKNKDIWNINTKIYGADSSNNTYCVTNHITTESVKNIKVINSKRIKVPKFITN